MGRSINRSSMISSLWSSSVRLPWAYILNGRSIGPSSRARESHAGCAWYERSTARHDADVSVVHTMRTYPRCIQCGRIRGSHNRTYPHSHGADVSAFTGCGRIRVHWVRTYPRAHDCLGIDSSGRVLHGTYDAGCATVAALWRCLTSRGSLMALPHLSWQPCGAAHLP